MSLSRGVPEVLGGFELIERVASGGMASLYLARRAGARGFVKPVAVKVVHGHLAEDMEFVQMFVDEANICSRLSHPNIVHVEELGEENGHLYLVMEFVEGVPLRALLNDARRRNTPMPLALAVHVIANAADGLHYAHEARGDGDEPLHVVHRDVSPTNLLLSRSGHVKLIDFGVAKSSDQVHQTTTRKLKGKVAYMSPEQVRYEAIDRRSDIYSLGVVLWEVLANRRAFRAKDEVALVQEVLSRPLPPIDAVRDDLPERLVNALCRATARDPEARFETAQEFRRALMSAVPEAVHVQDSDVAEVVRRVMKAYEEGRSPQQRVRTTVPGASVSQTSSNWALGAGEGSASPVVMSSRALSMHSRVSADPRVSGDSRVAPLTGVMVPLEAPPPPHQGMRLALTVLGAALLAGAASVALLQYPWGSTPAPTATAPAPAPEEPVAPAPSAPSEANEPKQEGLQEAAKLEKQPEPAEKLDEPEPAEKRERSRPRRRSVRRRTEPRETVAAPKPKPKPKSDGVSVDGVLLASPDDLDAAAARGDTKKGRPVQVQQDGTTLADDYQ